MACGYIVPEEDSSSTFILVTQVDERYKRMQNDGQNFKE